MTFKIITFTIKLYLIYYFKFDQTIINLFYIGIVSMTVIKYSNLDMKQTLINIIVLTTITINLN